MPRSLKSQLFALGGAYVNGLTFHNAMVEHPTENSDAYTPLAGVLPAVGDIDIIPFMLKAIPPGAPLSIFSPLDRSGIIGSTYEKTPNTSVGPNVVSPDVTAGAGFARGGADAAQQAAAKAYIKSLSKQNFSQETANYLQQRTFADIKDAYTKMQQTPVLYLLINPTGFSVSHTKIVSDGNWGRNGAGVGIEHWGEGQPVIAAQGRIAGFYNTKQVTTTGKTQPQGGLSRATRQFSLSYQNFLSLFLLYRNNGYIWIEDVVDARSGATSKPNNLALVGSIALFYDKVIYFGSFNSFEITEEGESPFTLSYSFEFTVRQIYHESAPTAR